MLGEPGRTQFTPFSVSVHFGRTHEAIIRCQLYQPQTNVILGQRALCLSLSVCVFLSLCLSVYLVYLYVSVCLCVSFSTSVCLSLCLSILSTLSISVCVCLSLPMFVCLSVCLSILSTCQSLCVFLSMSVCLSVLSICLPLSGFPVHPLFLLFFFHLFVYVPHVRFFSPCERYGVKQRR